MGKGKGLFLRWVVTIRPATKFAEFIGYPFKFLTKLKHSLGCCYRSDVYFFHDFQSHPVWSGPRRTKYFNLDKRKNLF
jgi:hypothetical protein